MRWNRKRSLQKITENGRLPATELGMDESQYAIEIEWIAIDNDWMIRIGCLSWSFSVSSFWDFWKITYCSFIEFLSFWQKQPFDFNYSLSVSKYY